MIFLIILVLPVISYGTAYYKVKSYMTYFAAYNQKPNLANQKIIELKLYPPIPLYSEQEPVEKEMRPRYAFFFQTESFHAAVNPFNAQILLFVGEEYTSVATMLTPKELEDIAVKVYSDLIGDSDFVYSGYNVYNHPDYPAFYIFKFDYQKVKKVTVYKHQEIFLSHYVVTLNSGGDLLGIKLVLKGFNN